MKQLIKMTIWGYIGSGIMFYEFLYNRLFISYFLMMGYLIYFGGKHIKLCYENSNLL